MVQSKTQKRVQEILEAAVRLYSTVGYEKATYEKIAAECGATRPLVQHYFADRKEIFIATVQSIRSNLQTIIKSAIEPCLAEPTKAIEEYILANFRWANEFPNELKVWSLFYYYCSIDEEYKAINSQFVTQGRERIELVLKLGQKLGEFSFSTDPLEIADLIQNIITGRLVKCVTESMKDQSIEEYAKSTVEHVLSLLKETQYP